MTFIKWNKKDLLGIDEIDNQHKDIYDMVNNLHNLRSASKSKITEQFELLLSKFKKHFETEEQFMKELNVPILFSHKLEHQRALDKYAAYFETYKTSSSPFDEEILNSLKTWLYNHAEMKDKKLKQYVK